MPLPSWPRRVAGVATLSLASLACAQTPPAAPVAPHAPAAAPAAPGPIARIRDEGLKRSEIMATLSQLTDIVGPRLTGSPELRRASEWARDRFTAWGLKNAALEPWGPFGRGWSLRRFSAQIVAPQAIPLIAYPKAWSPSLPAGQLEAEIVHVDIRKPEDFARYRGKLRGAIVLDGTVQELKVGFEPLARRRTEADLLALANHDGIAGTTRPTTNSPLANPEQRAALALTPQRYQFFAEEGVAVLLQPSRLGEAGTLFTGAATVYPQRDPAAKAPKAEPAPEPSAPKKKGSGKSTPSAPAVRAISAWKTDAPPIIPQITVAGEHFNRLVRMAAAGEKLRAAIELQADYHTADLMAANVVAEIPGSDRADEVVMLGAHLDSWHSGTGATDNAAGSAVVMEAVRILRALNLPLRRTLRVALWSGEEQGLLGSKAYVAAHFGEAKNPPAPAATPPRDESDPLAFTPRPGPLGEIVKKPAYEKLSAYFNLDNGGGKIRGIYLQNNEAARPIFRAWLKPFKDLGAETVSLANTGGTDHLPFDQIGLPGFQFIQDTIEYNSRTHHGNMDVYDRVIADDLKQAAVIMAAFVYEAAMRDDLIPRKPARPAAATSTPAASP
ncbi:MAG: M20/M25/M40 family metallo-hydrolase [Opitutaceae bacterium]|nr:M20/M25/M40 family metallo-hydrolase [Opitutaceae bacterium]